MKNRPRDKKAGIIILAALIIISLAEVIFRAVTMGLEATSTSNFGEQLIVIALAVSILILTAKGKDRACYICYGAWAGYFVLDMLFELPSMLLTWFTQKPSTTLIAYLGDITLYLHTLSMVTIIAIGVLLVEYLNDGTIHNKAFNGLCIATITMLAVAIILSMVVVISGSPRIFILTAFNCTYRLAMVFLLSFFAYDSAKMQLERTKLSK